MNRIARFERLPDVLLPEGFPQELPLPTRATAGSAGYDFYAPLEIRLRPGETIVVPTGVRVCMEEGWVLLIFPRSGLGFKHRLGLCNTVGVIDADYILADNGGHIMIKLFNGGDHAVTIPMGAAFAQGVFLPFGITEDDNAAGERTGGFGSTNR